MHLSKHRMMFLEGEGAPGGGSPPPAATPPAETLIGGAQPPGGTPPPAATSFLVGEDFKFAADWTAKLPPEFQPKATGLAKFGSLTDLVKAHTELESKLGSKAAMVAIPNDKSTPEEIAAYRKVVGVPESADKYVLKPEKLPEGLTWDDSLAKPFQDIAFKHNIPPAAMQEIIGEYVKQQGLGFDAANGQIEAKKAEGKAMLAKEWGADHDRNLALVQRAVATVGGDPFDAGFNSPGIVKIILGLAKLTSEDSLVNGSHSPGMVGEARAKDIMTNSANPQHKAYKDGNPEVVKLVNDLMEAAYKNK